MTERLVIGVEGVVQGVGLRPFVYTLARSLDLGGIVCNDLRGVAFDVESDPTALRTFVDRLTTAPPPRAVVERVASAPAPPQGAAVGEVLAGPAHIVVVRTAIVGSRVLDMLVGDLLPHIC